MIKLLVITCDACNKELRKQTLFSGEQVNWPYTLIIHRVEYHLCNWECLTSEFLDV